MGDLNRRGIFTFLTKGTDKAKRDVDGVAKSMGGLGKTSEKSSKSMKGTSSQTNAVTKGLGGLVKGLGAAAAAYGALQLAQQAWKAAEHAADIRNISSAFESLTAQQGLTASSMLANMKKATRGTVDEMQLMVQANQAAMLGLDLNQFDSMMEIARSASLATGQSMDFMLNSIVTGIGRQSKLVLDNLGIVFDLESAYSSFAATLGKTADQLTEVEKKQAFTNKAMEAGLANAAKMGQDGMTAAEEFDRLRTATKDLGAAISEHLVDPLSKAAGFLADIVTAFERSMEVGHPTYVWNAEVGALVPADVVLAAGGPAAGRTRQPFRPLTEEEIIGPGNQDAMLADIMVELDRRIKASADVAMPAGVTPIIAEAWGMDAEAWDKVLDNDSFISSLKGKDTQTRAYFQGLQEFFTEDGKTNWTEYQDWMLQYIQDTYGDGSEGVDVMRRFQEFLAEDMPAAAEEGGLRTVAALQDTQFAIQGLGDAFAGLIMGNKLAMKEGLKIIAIEATARLKAVAAEASVEALWQTAQGVGALLWNPVKAAGHFKAAGLATLTAAAAGGAAGVMAHNIGGVGARFGVGGSSTMAASRSGESSGGSAVGGRESVNVTRTTPTTVNITIINNGTVNYGSEAHITAEALQDVLETGAVITPEQEVA